MANSCADGRINSNAAHPDKREPAKHVGYGRKYAFTQALS
jgi:hypothetical protein